MFGLSGTPTLPDGQWLLHMLVLLGLLALMLFSRRGTREEREERRTRQRGLSARLALGAMVVFFLWFGVVFAIGAGPLMKAFTGN